MIQELEGHPEYLCDKNVDMDMGAIIHQVGKKSMMPFIKSNLGRLSQREIAKQLGVGKTTINRWSEELGYKHLKHSVNEDFFDGWNEYSSYILGYIFADGNISWNPSRGYQSLTITSSERDKEHLDSIRDLISSTKPLLYSDKTKSYRLIANGKKLCKTIMKLGVVPRKSLIVKFPEIPEKHVRHFIRGVIDGDGTVRYVEREKSPYFEIQISSGSYDFIDMMVKTIKKETGIDSRIRKVGKNTFLTQYSCTRGMKLAGWIYRDCNLFMERKLNNYKKALEAKGGDSAL